VDANYAQADKIKPDVRPVWVCGDSMDEIDKSAPRADFIFTCPPYGDLEVYSDDPRDLSTMEYHTFIAAYKRIILRAVRKLERERFACVVVGDFRDDRGFYRGFVHDSVAAFKECNLGFYNEAVFLTPLATLPVRAGPQFAATRKLGKGHQNVLVFVKGDPESAAKVASDTVEQL
jgi:hypothetical protein